MCEFKFVQIIILGVGWGHNGGCQIYTEEEKEKNILEKHSGKKSWNTGWAD